MAMAYGCSQRQSVHSREMFPVLIHGAHCGFRIKYLTDILLLAELRLHAHQDVR